MTLLSFLKSVRFAVLIRQMWIFRTHKIQSPAIARSSITQFRCLRMLVSMFNAIYAATMMAAQTVLAGVAIFSLCFSIRRKGPLGVVAGILGADVVVVLAIAFSSLAEFHGMSCKVLRRLKTSPAYGLRGSRKALAALQPVSFKIGRFYFVDKMMVLTLVEFLITYIANMLLLLPE